MDIEVQHIAGCPHCQEAAARLRAALDETGSGDVAIEFRLIDTPESAVSAHFAGSPTFMVDGVDLFPSSGAVTSLACRVYQTAEGLRGLPTTAQIVDALRLRIPPSVA